MNEQECKAESVHAQTKSILNKDVCCTTREMTAKEILFEKSKGLHTQAEQLYALAQSLPDNLNRDADRAIKNMLNNFH